MHSPSHWNSFARLGKSFSGIEQFQKTSCLSSPRIKFPIYEVHLVLFQKQIQRYSSARQSSMHTCRLSPLLGAHPERPDKTAPRALSTTVPSPALRVHEPPLTDHGLWGSGSLGWDGRSLLQLHTPLHSCPPLGLLQPPAGPLP